MVPGVKAKVLLRPLEGVPSAPQDITKEQNPDKYFAYQDT